jgi:hypothetical protein
MGEQPTSTPDDALQIDSKLDDGLPGAGRVMANRPSIPNDCATDTDPNLARYNLGVTERVCWILFLTGF